MAVNAGSDNSLHEVAAWSSQCIFAASAPLSSRAYKKTSTQNWYGIRGSVQSGPPVGDIWLRLSNAACRRLLGELVLAAGRPLLIALPLEVVFESRCRVAFGLALLSCPAAILVLLRRDECRVDDLDT